MSKGKINPILLCYETVDTMLAMTRLRLSSMDGWQRFLTAKLIEYAFFMANILSNWLLHSSPFIGESRFPFERWLF